MNPVFLKIPGYWLQDKLNARWYLPASYTVSVTSACNASCQTCNQRSSTKDLSLAAYERIAQSVNQKSLWLTLTGGEPFLRKDLLNVASTLIKGLQPLLVTLPTNGSFPHRVESTLNFLASQWPDRHFIVNVSLDEIGNQHDRLRGLRGSWDLALQTIRKVQDLKAHCNNVIVGVHTVISKFNVERFPLICDEVLALGPDSYITEIAGERQELGTIGSKILPSVNAYQEAMAYFVQKTRGRKAPLLARFIAHLRELYYQDVVSHLTSTSSSRLCHAGNLTCHILADGRVTACGVRCDIIGHLKDVDYQLPRLWHHPNARRIRRMIKKEKCSCTMANQAYLNLAMDPLTLFRLVRMLARPIESPHPQ